MPESRMMVNTPIRKSCILLHHHVKKNLKLIFGLLVIIPRASYGLDRCMCELSKSPDDLYRFFYQRSLGIAKQMFLMIADGIDTRWGLSAEERLDDVRWRALKADRQLTVSLVTRADRQSVR